MKAIVCIGLFGMIAIALARPEEDKYPTKYDNVNVEEILANDRILGNYFNCIMQKGKCTADGKELQIHIQDALETDCAKCSEAQKEGVRKVMSHLINNKEELWKELVAKYDPELKYSKKHEDDLRKIKA